MAQASPQARQVARSALRRDPRAHAALQLPRQVALPSAWPRKFQGSDLGPGHLPAHEGVRIAFRPAPERPAKVPARSRCAISSRSAHPPVAARQQRLEVGLSRRAHEVHVDAGGRGVPRGAAFASPPGTRGRPWATPLERGPRLGDEGVDRERRCAAIRPAPGPCGRITSSRMRTARWAIPSTSSSVSVGRPHMKYILTWPCPARRAFRRLDNSVVVKSLLMTLRILGGPGLGRQRDGSARRPRPCAASQRPA